MRALMLPFAAMALWATPAFASLSEVSAHLTAARTMTADFVQTAAGGSVARGTVTLARPGRVRFEYDPSVPMLVVANGRTLTMIDYEVAQVSSWPIRGTPLAVLLDPTISLNGFAKILGPDEGGLPGFVTVQARDRKHPEYGVLTLYFARDGQAPGGLTLSAWRALDAQGTMTQVQLSRVQYNVAVSKAKFTYRDPRARGRAPGKG